MKKSHTKKTGAIVIIALLAVGVFYWNGDESSSTSTETQIETSALERGDINRVVSTSGSVRALITVEVGSQLSGQIQEIYADYNTPVTKDQIIALIDPQTFETRVLQNNADLDVANANVAVQRASINRATANLTKARLDLERTQPLVENGTLPKADLDTAQAAFESAQADLTMAEAQLENALATRAQRQATLESAKIDLERTKIRSPIDGVVIERAVDQGQTVAASMTAPILFNIAQDLTEIQIEANVDEADIGNVQEGNEVTFSVDAFPNTEFDGVVDQVRLAPNELNNVVTYTVIITAKNPSLKLLPGMTAIVEIITGKSEDVLRVRNRATRFKPSANSPLIAQSEEDQSGGSSATDMAALPGSGIRASGFRGPDIKQLASQLDLTSEQVVNIEADVNKFVSEIRSSFQSSGGFQPGGDMNAMRERMQQRREQMTRDMALIYQRHLSDEQYRKYQQLMRQQSETRLGTLWIQSDDGKIKPVNVRLGISDDNYTHIISRDLQAGQLVVTRIREVNN